MGQITKKTNGIERRVLVLMPTGRDAALVCASLKTAGIDAHSCADIGEFKKAFASGSGAVLIAEEALKNGNFENLVETLNQQPVWSDIPIVLFAGNATNSEKLLTNVGTRLNTTIVERPIRITMLVSAVQGALRARQKQYQTRDLLNQLKESDHQKDLFLAMLSHELRTPLNSILGWIQLLRGESSVVDTEHGLEVIERNARAQSELISDILFVSRIITGKLEINLEQVELIPIIEEAVEVVLPSIEAKNIRLEVFFDPEIKQIKGDRKRLKQVFWNILSNALKFTPENGQINVSAFINSGFVEIQITDSGIGIEPDFLPVIFERFKQADSSYTRKVGGLGLGLAIVHHLVEKHGGSITATSEGKNRGSIFTIKLPVLQTEQTVSTDENFNQTATAETIEPPEGIHILLVEDNDDSREMYAFLFAQYDLKITAVASASAALTAFEKEIPDILISDIGMPEQDGYYLIGKIREFPPEKGGLIPAVALTGYASLQDRELAVKSGFQGHLSKPIEIDELFKLLKKLVNKKVFSKDSV